MAEVVDGVVPCAPAVICVCVNGTTGAALEDDVVMAVVSDDTMVDVDCKIAVEVEFVGEAFSYHVTLTVKDGVFVQPNDEYPPGSTNWTQLGKLDWSLCCRISIALGRRRVLNYQNTAPEPFGQFDVQP